MDLYQYQYRLTLFLHYNKHTMQQDEYADVMLSAWVIWLIRWQILTLVAYVEGHISVADAKKFEQREHKSE